ncbi:MAG TPA: alpha-amylase [Euryarchaeota archaeon]|nr:alpha-amylase [Euryarchaeota archaeon]
MSKVCFYFEVHQPFRLNRFSVFSIGEKLDPMENYFDWKLNREIFEKVARKCYLPTNHLLLKLIEKFDGSFRISFGITGVLMDYCDQFMPEVMDSFEELYDTGCVDLICETYYHSLSSLYDDLDEFEDQVRMHRDQLYGRFKHRPTVFRNTEAIYDNRIASKIEELGFGGIITEGAQKILGWRSPNYIYRPVGSDNLKVLLRNHLLSDDIAFRFSTGDWKEFPLTADKYASWLNKCEGDLVNVFIDYETFGEHQWRETGIFEFLGHLPGEFLKHPGAEFLTVSEAVERSQPVGEIDVPCAISWADMDRDVSTWLGNEMQMECFNELKEIGTLLRRGGNGDFMRIWRMLQTSDHLYYMSTKGLADGDVHRYFNPYSYPYEAFINYMNILQDLRKRI